MSVYTRVERGELEKFLTEYSIGKLIEYKGISAGIENTNYFVTTTQGPYVLTLFEALGMDDLPYFMDMTAHLADNGVPCPHPIPDNNNHYLRKLNNKPAALVTRLKGINVINPNIKQVTALGSHLGHMHVAGQSFKQSRNNTRGPHWWVETSKQISSKLSDDELIMLEEEIKFQKQHNHSDLPTGIIHADMFRDNVMFTDNELTGIIDFYYACNDVLLYDIAVTVNDWCSMEDGSLDKEKTLAFVRAYHAQRPLSEQEHTMWPVMLRAGALRFWLSRLYDLHFPRDGELTHTKNPDVFKNTLIHRRDNEGQILKLWP